MIEMFMYPSADMHVYDKKKIQIIVLYMAFISLGK